MGALINVLISVGTWSVLTLLGLIINVTM